MVLPPAIHHHPGLPPRGPPHPKRHATRGQWDVNSSGWSPWSGLFTRPISALTDTMRPPLPSLRNVLAFGEHRNYLEIGCGMGRGLLEVQALMANSTTRSPPGDNAAAPFCATGLSFLNYTHFMYNVAWTEEPTSLKEIRNEGLAAIFEEGALPPETVRALRSRFRLAKQPEPAPAPVIIDADYNYGLPFLADTFDLIIEQGALKWEEPRLLPDPERRLEDYGRFFFDELLRVLRIGGSAIIDLGQLRQNYGNHWLFRSTAILGPASKADVLLEHEGWPTTHRNRSEGMHAVLASINNFTDAVRDGTKNMYRGRGHDRVLPLEVALGSVTLHHSKTPDCSPATCSQQPACGLPGGPGLHDVRKRGATRGVQRVCVLSLLYAHSTSQAVFVHKFAPGPAAGAADGAPEEARCLAAARALPHVQLLLEQLPGQFVPESRRESSAVAAALRERGDGLRELFLQVLNNEAPGNKTFHTFGNKPPPRTAEMMLNAVRLWYREPKPCHDARVPARHSSVSEGTQRDAFCTAGAPRIAWSNLHTYTVSGL